MFKMYVQKELLNIMHVDQIANLKNEMERIVLLEFINNNFADFAKECGFF